MYRILFLLFYCYTIAAASVSGLIIMVGDDEVSRVHDDNNFNN